MMKIQKDLDKARRNRNSGFTLIELMVAMSIFLVAGGAAFALLQQHMPLYSQQQNQAGLNITLRNAVTQMQVDVVNAGTGYYPGANIPAWPIGVTIQNQAGGAGCHVAGTTTYAAGCFDTLNIIATDPNTPPVHPEDIGANCVSSTSSNIFVTPPAGLTTAQVAGDFFTGDQLLLVKGDGSQMTTTVLTANGSVTGAKVKLQHNPTGATGTNSSGNDPLGISTNANNKLGTTFCTNDWILKLTPITYKVDVTNAANPKLVRTQTGTTATIADQIIGFKVGAMIWNSVTSQDNKTYSFDPATYTYDYSSVRSVLISLIGRTPNISNTPSFTNSFDGGPYKIEALNVVINPRNLSMNDN